MVPILTGTPAVLEARLIPLVVSVVSICMIPVASALIPPAVESSLIASVPVPELCTTTLESVAPTTCRIRSCPLALVEAVILVVAPTDVKETGPPSCVIPERPPVPVDMSMDPVPAAALVSAMLPAVLLVLISTAVLEVLIPADSRISELSVVPLWLMVRCSPAPSEFTINDPLAPCARILRVPEVLVVRFIPSDPERTSMAPPSASPALLDILIFPAVLVVFTTIASPVADVPELSTTTCESVAPVIPRLRFCAAPLVAMVKLLAASMASRLIAPPERVSTVNPPDPPVTPTVPVAPDWIWIPPAALVLVICTAVWSVFPPDRITDSVVALTVIFPPVLTNCEAAPTEISTALGPVTSVCASDVSMVT